MHRHLYAQCRIQLELEALSPILVQGEQSGQTASFHRAIDPRDGQEKYVIPATSLKGVWRSTAERILRTFDSRLACDPFDQTLSGILSQSCGKRLETISYADPFLLYGDLCPACRLFGATVYAGALELTDCWCADRIRPTSRTRIAIDRVAGNVSAHLTFSVAPLPTGTRFHSFETTINNPTLWQIGLLALVFREMTNGRSRLGSGGRMGMGHVAVKPKQIEMVYPKRLYEQLEREGEGRIVSSLALAPPRYANIEGLSDPSVMPNLSNGSSSDTWRTSLFTRFVFEGQVLDEFLRTCVEHALAPRLREKRHGFHAAQPIQGEKEQ